MPHTSLVIEIQKLLITPGLIITYMYQFRLSKTALLEQYSPIPIQAVL